ncbi:PbrT family lead (Pb2+) uptake porter [Glutamicibacter soli]|uniref:PbrT family lead (Pb2+) uptake porter n=1 Tax=Glutamicibacter soli TaxID=453836 RepID=A0A365YB56_9MICC|nr:iron uptake system protein EfeO [Glutamicibacter soli]RBL99559.1 PbrT family lead (Pb2+) uptake porter [Glutamicibacter soli]
MTKFLAPAALLALGALALTGCTDNNATASADGSIAVSASDDACTLATGTAAGGTLKFSVKNEGTKVNEFYLLAEDGLRIVGEVENIGPGVTRDLVVMAPEGSYFAACKPGMVGDGIRSPFTVTAAAAGQEVSADRAALQQTAADQYASYVKDQSQQLLAGTEDFAAAFAAGEEAEAKQLYPQVRMHWERIEPVAESFGDLDPILDAREADLEEGQEFTGWHRAEKDLWAPKGYTKMSQAQRQQIADGLVKHTTELVTRAQALEFTPDKLANGAKELLDEVATGKVTGEEEAFSHTDLWDFQANLEGAKIAYEDLAPLLEGTDDELDAQLKENFEKLQAQLDAYRVGEGFKYYDQLGTEQVQELAAGVDALSEPLSRLTAAVVK